MVVTLFHGVLERFSRSVGSGVGNVVSSKSLNISEFSTKGKQWS